MQIVFRNDRILISVRERDRPCRDGIRCDGQMRGDSKSIQGIANERNDLVDSTKHAPATGEIEEETEIDFASPSGTFFQRERG